MFINTASFILSLIRDLGPGGFFFFLLVKTEIIPTLLGLFHDSD